MPEHPALAQARALFSQGRFDMAKQTLLRAIQKSPGDAGLQFFLGGILTDRREYAQAIYYLRSAVTLAPAVGLYHAQLGEALLFNGQLKEGEAEVRTGLRLDPSLYAARINLANVCVARMEFDETEDVLRAAMGLRPERPEAPNNLSLVLLDTARPDEADAVLREAAARHPRDLSIQGSFALMSNYVAGPTRDESLRRHRVYGQLVAAAARPLPPIPGPRDPDRVLRIGILSPDLREHSVGYFIEPFFLHHTPGVEIAVYSGHKTDDDRMTLRLRDRAALWREVSHMPDDALARRMRDDRVDVALDLSGATMGHRLGALAWRPAPVQITYLGYPSTTGVPGMTHRIVDSITDPPGAEAFATERLLHADPCFLCYTIPADAPEPQRTAREGVTFGSFNVISKVGPQVLDAWARVMHATPGSRLLLKARSLGSESLRARLRADFERRGIEPGRVECLAFVKGRMNHLALYSRVDVALDPFPYNGTTTTCEALSMGVPVVTMEGDRHASRVGVSLLRAAGLDELVARSPEAYIELASSLAQDTARLDAFRRDLRPRMLASPLCDAQAFVERFERAIRSAWREWCSSAP